jgi:uncharacterized protein (TIGR03086 family)
MTDSTELLRDVDRSAAVLTAVAGAVRDDQWELPTVCADWDVRGVVNHVVAGCRMVDAAFAGQGPPEWGADYLKGADPVAVLGGALAANQAEFGKPGALEQVLRAPRGEMPGAQLARMRVAELLVHAWDVARATGQPTDLDPELSGRILEWWRAALNGVPRDGMPFAGERPAPPGATQADALAAYLGRSVQSG